MLLPIFLTATLGAGPAVVGLVEGLTDRGALVALAGSSRAAQRSIRRRTGYTAAPARGAGMSIRVRNAGDVTILELEGDIAIGVGGFGHPLDLRGRRIEDIAQTLRRVLEGGQRHILLDLERVNFFDSAGLGELVACRKRTLERGGDLKLMKPSPRVRQMFEMTLLTGVFEIYSDEDEALRSFRTTP